MTIDISNNDPRISYSVAQGVTQTSFAIPFEFFDDSDVNVYVDGTLKTITTDYTISGGGGSTGTVNISVTGQTGGSTVVLTRDITIERTTDFTAGADINRAALNTQLDTLTGIAADIKDATTLALRYNDRTVGVTTELPDVESLKGNYLAFNPTTGAPEAGANSQDVTSIAAVTSDIARLADIEDGTLATNAIQTVSGISSNVSTVAGVASNVTAVGNSIGNVNTVAASIADVNRYAEEYTISATAPTSPSEGDLWYDSVNNALKYYDGAAWNDYAGDAAASASAAATSETNAAASEAAAGASETAAATSATNATSSASSAASSASAAATSETNAAASATSAASDAASAATSETNAASSASNAASSASAASTSATNAASSATAAASSASAAAASQTSAAASAAAAANSYDLFDDRYLGSKTSDPILDNDGNALVAGALYFNSTANEMRVYDGANWIAATSAGNVSLLEYNYTATNGQTTFSGADDNAATMSYTQQNLIVTLNGVVLENGTDYTANDGTSIVLSTGAATGDELNVVAFKSFTTADMVPASTGGTFSGGVNVLGNVGIGTSSPAYTLDIQQDGGGGLVRGRILNTGTLAADTSVLQLQISGTTAENLIYFGDAADNNAGQIRYDHATDYMSISVNAAERARIDASGNLLVGKTAADLDAAGVEFRAGSYNGMTNNGGVPLYLNRLTSDGGILEFRKDGSTVGSIGVVSGTGDNLYITGDSTHGGLQFGTNLVSAAKNGVPSDATLDLGSSTYRWKNLYLSGGVYLGGTGGANYLDDYEEGTWTPTFTNTGTATLQYARYVKIGNTVSFWVRVGFASGVSANSSYFSMPFASTTMSSGTWTRGTIEGGFVEPQVGTSCYFSSAPSGYSGLFIITATYSTQ